MELGTDRDAPSVSERQGGQVSAPGGPHPEVRRKPLSRAPPGLLLL